MECAALFTVARLGGLRAGAVLGVVGNLASNEHAYTDVKHEPLAHSYKQKAEEAIEHAIEVAIGAVKYLKGD
jgi:uridine phosphorylase